MRASARRTTASRRWGRAIGEAGRRPVDLDELLRLQSIVIGDARFVHLGFREEGGFVGEHDRETRMPLPDHISARPDDLHSLIDGMVAFDRGPALGLDAVIAAAVLAFGFVYVHPFEDGNGRIHRYLIHHVLAQRGFNPAGSCFPVSAAILERIEEYRTVLEDYSQRLLPLIRWEPTADGNVHVLNDTSRFLPLLRRHAACGVPLCLCAEDHRGRSAARNRFLTAATTNSANAVEAIVDMPDSNIDLLFRFLHQNGGSLSKRAREHEFAQLTNAEVASTEEAYAAAFDAE